MREIDLEESFLLFSLRPLRQYSAFCTCGRHGIQHIGNTLSELVEGVYETSCSQWQCMERNSETVQNSPKHVIARTQLLRLSSRLLSPWKVTKKFLTLEFSIRSRLVSYCFYPKEKYHLVDYKNKNMFNSNNKEMD